MPRWPASSATVGDRPSFWDSSEVALVSESLSSCSRRGTRIAQPLSRKCRLISPTMVGVAYVENSTPRSRSNRSTDLIRPIVATWIRSSSGSPRLRKRRARYSTSGRCISTSWSRMARRSGSSSSSVASWTNISRACARSLAAAADLGDGLTASSCSATSVVPEPLGVESDGTGRSGSPEEADEAKLTSPHLLALLRPDASAGRWSRAARHPLGCRHRRRALTARSTRKCPAREAPRRA